MPSENRYSRVFKSESFWLALMFWLTALHLPSPFEAFLAVLFVYAVWQLRPATKGAAIGLGFAIWVGLAFATQLLLLALPKALVWSWLSSSAIRVPAQLGFFLSIGKLGSWVAFASTALLRYYELNEKAAGGKRLRFAVASTIIWAGFALVGERVFLPDLGSRDVISVDPLVSLAIFLAFPVSFLFWRFKGRSWITRCLLAVAALFSVSLVYYVLPLAMMFFRASMLTVSFYVVAISVNSKLWHPYNVAVAILWAGAAAYLGSTPKGDASTGRMNLRLLPLLPVLLCAVPALAVAFSLDFHKQHVEAMKEAEKVARGEREQKKLAAMLKWRLLLPREAPSELATLQPPVVGPDGAAYVVVRRESRLHAVDSSGHLKWSFPGVISAEPAVGPGGTVYAVGVDSALYALDDGTGQIRWSTKFSDGLAMICTGPALAADGTVYTLTQQNSFTLQLNAVSPNGKLRWQVSEPTDKMCSIHDVVEMAPQLLPSPVVASDGTIYFTHAGLLYAVDPRGTHKWSAHTERPIAKMLLGKQGEVYAYGEQLTAFDPGGAEQWTSQWHTALWLHPDIGQDGTIYLVDSGPAGRGLVAINPDGSEKWTLADDASIQSVLASPDGTLYISAGNGAFYALDADRHKLDWGYTSAIQGCAPVMAPDGTIYAATYDGEFFALHPPSRERSQSSQMPQ